MLFRSVKALVDACRALRGEMNVSPSTRLPLFTVGDTEFMRGVAPVLQALAKLNEVKVFDDEVERAAHYENLKLPEDLDYNQVSALSIEVRQRLSRQRPETLGQASRMSGITPAAISLLLIHLKRSRVKGFAQDGAAASSTEAA